MTVTLDRSLEKLGAWPARLTLLVLAAVLIISSRGTICLWQAWLGPGWNPRPENASWEACSLFRVLVTLLSACIFSGVSSKCPWAWGCCCEALSCTSLHMLSGSWALILWKAVLFSRNPWDVNGGSGWTWGEGFSKWLENGSLLLQASAKAAGGGKPDSGASPGPLAPICIWWPLRWWRGNGLTCASSSMSDGARRESGLPGTGGREMSSGEIHSYSSPESTSTGRSRPWALSLLRTSCFTPCGSWPFRAPLTAKVAAGWACSFKMEKPKFWVNVDKASLRNNLRRPAVSDSWGPWPQPHRTWNHLSTEPECRRSHD